MTLRWRSKMQENMLRGSVVAISCIANVSVALWLSFESLFVWMIFQRM